MKRELIRENAQSRVSVLLCTILILCTALGQPIHAEDIAVNAGVDRTEITVGDPILYVVQVTADEGTVVDVPHLPAAWGEFMILSQQPLAGENLTPTAGKITTGRMYQLTAYRVGEFATPPLPIRYQATGGEWQEYTTAPISITVRSVLTAPVDVTDTLALRGLKPPATMRPIYSLWVGYALLAASLALCAWWGYSYWQRRRRAATLAPQVIIDPRPAYVIAYEELAKIAGEKLPEQGLFKAHYTRVSDCIREYAERLYGIPALDRTTEVFLGELRRAKINRDHWALFHRLLEESDLVKFAKYKPPIADARELLEHARLIVDVTKPSEERVMSKE